MTPAHSRAGADNGPAAIASMHVELARGAEELAWSTSGHERTTWVRAANISWARAVVQLLTWGLS